MGVENFNGGAKYEKTINFKFGEIFYIYNHKALLNDTEHQNKLINKLIREFISYIAVKYYGRYQSLPALSIFVIYMYLMSNNCTNLTLLKNNSVVYFISASAVPIIEIVLKISLSNTDAKDEKFKVMMTLLP